MFEQINSEMATLAREIENLSVQVEDKRAEYENAKHNYELAYSGHVITGKAKNTDWTQTDVIAYATRESKDVRAALIVAQGAYRKLRAQLSAKSGNLDAVKERGWNLRQELRRLPG